MRFEKNAARKMRQKQGIKIATLMALGIFSFSEMVLRSQPVRQKTVSNQIVTGSDQGGCQEGKLVPNVKPRWKKGQTFRYETIKTEKTKSAAPQDRRGAPGQVVLKSEPFPFQQTITIGENAENSGEPGLYLRRDGVLENPMIPMSEQTPDGGLKDKSKSFINAEGRIRFCESETTMTFGGSASVSQNSSSGFTESSDLHYFYGYWMLALTPDFSWECLKNSPQDRVSIKLKVTGMEALNGRDCFVVERTYRKDSEEPQLITYWIDKVHRIAVQVKKGNFAIRLFS